MVTHSHGTYHLVHFIQEVSRLRLDNSKLKHKLEDYKLILSQPDNPADERAMEQLKEHNVRLKRNLTEQVNLIKIFTLVIFIIYEAGTMVNVCKCE